LNAKRWKLAFESVGASELTIIDLRHGLDRLDELRKQLQLDIAIVEIAMRVLKKGFETWVTQTV